MCTQEFDGRADISIVIDARNLIARKGPNERHLSSRRALVYK